MYIGWYMSGIPPGVPPWVYLRGYIRHPAARGIYATLLPVVHTQHAPPVYIPSMLFPLHPKVYFRLCLSVPGFIGGLCPILLARVPDIPNHAGAVIPMFLKNVTECGSYIGDLPGL